MAAGPATFASENVNSGIDLKWYPITSMSPRMLTEKFIVGGLLKSKFGGNIYQYFISAQVDVWGSSGNQVVTAGQMTATPTNAQNAVLNLAYMLYTGPNKAITAADTYRVVFTVRMADNSTWTWQSYIVINATPY